ncbi:DUF5304 domain-containing protein [Streptomyces sp. PR69]|uniref:DUF5304 domain-containing protein n=1 Tax=Streptomyces sp. PR69 TaxID=2984950 RepID=UPI0022648355|nr:DUF5304 domain-containing protein [Streptomyces sp. PR69]
MSDATERPDAWVDADADADAWADACAEDLKAERARRREQYGEQPGTASEEFRRLLDAVADKVASIQGSLPGTAAQNAVQQFVRQAKAAVEPVIERNPQVFDHLAAAGGELLAAYRSAVEGHERRWTQRPSDTAEAGDPRDGRSDEGPGPSERIDLD